MMTINYLKTNTFQEPKVRSLILEKDNMILKKSIYTNCKKKDGCPPWSLRAEEVSHDKKNQIINYKNASFRFYDVPVIYFPKFFILTQVSIDNQVF